MRGVSTSPSLQIGISTAGFWILFNCWLLSHGWLKVFTSILECRVISLSKVEQSSNGIFLSLYPLKQLIDAIHTSDKDRSISQLREQSNFRCSFFQADRQIFNRRHTGSQIPN